VTDPQINEPARISVKARVAGCEVSVDVSAPIESFKDSLKQVLGQLTEIGVEPIPVVPPGQREVPEETPDADGPVAALARELDLTDSDLRKVLGVKGDSIQLYRAGQYSVADAVCVIGLAYEKGLGHAGMPFDAFSSLVAANHIKTKTPLRTLCFNLIRDGRVDKKSYEDGGLVVLTPAGEQQAARAIKAVVGGERPARRASRKARKKR
jgi:hypothetical protein